MGKLPSPIPGNVYRAVEHHLRHRAAVLRRALLDLSDAESDAGAIRSPGAESVGGGSGGSDRVCGAALRIAEARTRVTRAQTWLSVYQQTMDVFSGTDAGRAVRYLFERALSQAESARKLNCDRQTIRRYKDDFIIRASFLAVGCGLIRMKDDGRIIDNAGDGDHREPDA